MSQNDKENLVISLNKSGKTSSDIAEEIGMSSGYVCKILKKHNLKSNIRPKFGTYQIKCEICHKDFLPKSRNAVTCSLECKKSLLSQKTIDHAIKSGAINVITPDKESIIISMRQQGKSVIEIADSTGIGSKAVRQWISRNTEMSTLKGNDKYNKRMTENEKERALNLSKDGVHVKIIANKLGYGVTSMKDFLIKSEQKLNIPESSFFYNKRMTGLDIQKIMEMHKNGKNLTDISKEVNFSATAIRSLFRKIKIKPNIEIVDISRPCVICGISFKPKYSDGVARDTYKTCSPVCANRLKSKNKIKYTEEDVETVVDMAKNGFSNETIVGETGVNINKVKEIVSEHNLYKTQFVGGSAPENEIKLYIESLGLKTQKFKFPTLEYGKEIDILTQLDNGKKIGFEYCGVYWHCEDKKQDKARLMHKKKLKKANLNDISLITVFGDEWTYRQSQVKAFIKARLNKNENHLYARDTVVEAVNKKDAEKFLDTYHIQGSGAIEIAYGLFYEKELVGIMTGNKHHRSAQGDMFVLNRLCFKDNVTVVGGSSKLFKRLAEYAKSHKYTKIISWSDNRWSEGNVYKNLNFNLEKELDVDYSYVSGNKRLSKQSCKKSELLKKGAIGSTEREMALSLGLYRIWDCGKKRWVFNL